MNWMASFPEARFALEAVRRAGVVARRVQAELADAAFAKSDRSPVTVADFAAQAIVARLLEEAFPNDPLVAEEDSRELRGPDGQRVLEQVLAFVRGELPEATSETVCAWIDRGAGDPTGRFWTLDPVDGTKGFLRGEQYAIALGLVVDGQVRIGVLGCPNLTEARRPERGGPGSMVVAVRGHGAWTAPLAVSGDFTQLRVSSRTDPAAARLLRSVESAHTDVDLTEAWVRTLGIQVPPVEMDSQAKYAVLAAGGADLILRLPPPESPEYRENLWDQAAGSLVLEEAGGRTTDIEEKPLDFTTGRRLIRNRGVLASNGHLHDVAHKALARIRGS